jgi:hypothetical protein
MCQAIKHDRSKTVHELTQVPAESNLAGYRLCMWSAEEQTQIVLALKWELLTL